MPQNWTPKNQIAKIIYAAGFQYDPGQDIIFSRMNAWQRDFGYAYVYDFVAPVTISAVIDCEPFFFRYNNMDWMIELWKGQYGIETGAEIGVYINKRPLLDYILGYRPHDSDNAKFFDCAGKKELLKMSFTLNRNGVPLFSRGPEEHWWLTGFKWGVLSDPEDLTMNLNITFPAEEMCKTFVAALEKAGYQNISVDVKSVSFTFDKPTSYQPRLDPECKTSVDSAQKNNSQLVEYHKSLNLKNNDPNEIPDNAADSLIAYFNSYGPERFEEYIKEVLKSSGFSLSQINKSLKRVFKNQNPIKKIFNAIVSFFKKIFG